MKQQINCSSPIRADAGAALDVYENEPLPVESPLLKWITFYLLLTIQFQPCRWSEVHRKTIFNLLDGLGITPPSEDHFLVC